MSHCGPHFGKFKANLDLDATRVARIMEKRARLDKYLGEDDELRALGDSGTILQGSYRNKTIIKPRNDGEYDVDVCWRIKDPAELGFEAARDVVDFVIKRLRADYHYEDRIERKNRCIRIDYAGDFHLDLVLMQAADACPIIADYGANNWVESDPEAFRVWVNDVNKEAGGELLDTIRFVREWALEQFADEDRPSGIFLTNFVGRHHALTRRVQRSRPGGYDPYFTGLLHRSDPGAILADTAHIMLGCWRNKDLDKSCDLPVQPFDDLAASWSNDQKELFEKKLVALSAKSRRACTRSTDEEAAEVWQELFGARFPRSL